MSWCGRFNATVAVKLEAGHQCRPIPTAAPHAQAATTAEFDPDLARQRLQLSMDLFLTLVERFIRDQQDCVKQVATALDSKTRQRRNGYYIPWKGLAATLGAYALSSQAATLEAELKQDGKLSDWPAARNQTCRVVRTYCDRFAAIPCSPSNTGNG